MNLPISLYSKLPYVKGIFLVSIYRKQSNPHTYCILVVCPTSLERHAVCGGMGRRGNRDAAAPPAKGAIPLYSPLSPFSMNVDRLLAYGVLCVWMYVTIVTGDEYNGEHYHICFMSNPVRKCHLRTGLLFARGERVALYWRCQDL